MNDELKVGDRVVDGDCQSPRVIKMIEGEWAWTKEISSGKYLTFKTDQLTKLPDFFQVGHSYRSKLNVEITFDCHFVGRIGPPINGGRYAAGRWMHDEYPMRAATFTQFDDWIEI